MKNPNESNGTISDCYFVLFFGWNHRTSGSTTGSIGSIFGKNCFCFLLKNSALRQRGWSLELEQEERCMRFFWLSTLERYLEAHFTWESVGCFTKTKILIFLLGHPWNLVACGCCPGWRRKTCFKENRLTNRWDDWKRHIKAPSSLGHIGDEMFNWLIKRSNYKDPSLPTIMGERLGVAKTLKRWIENLLFFKWRDLYQPSLPAVTLCWQGPRDSIIEFWIFCSWRNYAVVSQEISNRAHRTDP